MKFAVRYCFLVRTRYLTSRRYDFIRDSNDLDKAAIYHSRDLAETDARAIDGDVICLDDENICLLCPVS